tara:strand:+ start:332 stop:586 length:255 start_codon:yes stop_codon:yes gene_type:complete
MELINSVLIVLFVFLLVILVSKLYLKLNKTSTSISYIDTLINNKISKFTKTKEPFSNSFENTSKNAANNLDTAVNKPTTTKKKS